MGMVDAAIGGKGALIWEVSKTRLAYLPCDEVFIDPLFLTNILERELTSGFAEVIKYGLIYDPEFSKRLLQINPAKVQDWMPVIRNCVRIKDEIVTKDPKEQGLRKILNFGHTMDMQLRVIVLKMILSLYYMVRQLLLG